MKVYAIAAPGYDTLYVTDADQLVGRLRYLMELTALGDEICVRRLSMTEEDWNELSPGRARKFVHCHCEAEG